MQQWLNPKELTLMLLCTFLISERSPWEVCFLLQVYSTCLRATGTPYQGDFGSFFALIIGSDFERSNSEYSFQWYHVCDDSLWSWRRNMILTTLAKDHLKKCLLYHNWTLHTRLVHMVLYRCTVKVFYRILSHFTECSECSRHSWDSLSCE